jgi:hypothetical protein
MVRENRAAYSPRLALAETAMAGKAAPKVEPTAEAARLAAARDDGVPWKQWGPYLSERQWGAVHED